MIVIFNLIKANRDASLLNNIFLKELRHILKPVILCCPLFAEHRFTVLELL